MIIKPDFKNNKKAEQAAALIALQADRGEVSDTGEQSGGGDKCLNVQEMAALIDNQDNQDNQENRCDPEELEIFKSHLSRCEDCYQEWLSLKLESDGQAGEGHKEYEVRGSRLRRYKYIGSALALAASVVVFLNISDPLYDTSYQMSPSSLNVEEAAGDEFLFDEKEIEQVQPINPPAKIAAERTVSAPPQPKRKNVNIAAAPPLPAGRAGGMDVMGVENDILIGAAAKVEKEPQVEILTEVPPAAAVALTKPMAKEQQDEASVDFGVEKKVSPPLKLTSRKKAQTSSARKDRERLTSVEKIFVQGAEQSEKAKSATPETEAVAFMADVEPQKAKDIDSWLQSVQESCRQGKKQRDFWSTLQLQGKNMLAAQGPLADKQTADKIVAALELLGGMAEHTVTKQCDMLLDLLADGEKNR